VKGIGATASAARAWLRRHRWSAIVVALLVIAVAVGAAASWHFSSAVLVPDHSPRPEDQTVERLAPGRVILRRTEESERPGVYGLAWQGGHAVIGRVVDGSAETVTRTLRSVRGYLAPGMDVAIARVHTGDPRQALGLPFASVRIPGELGPMPAWLVPGSGSTWAIFVHGINDTPQGGLHLLPTLRRAGLPSLAITYREDLGAPASPDGLHHMGLAEWQDLEAAARYALDRGARRLILVGYSMGGSLVAQFMQNSPLADRVAGLVLDAPALDWKETISFNATEMGLPSFSTIPVEWAIDARIDADWDELDALRHTDVLQLPILLFHGGEDGVVPISTSEELAEALPRWVTYFRVPRAGHTQAWNVGPALYERRVAGFLTRLRASGRG
jgi:uncharacterized protein